MAVAVLLLFALPRETHRVSVEAEAGTLRIVELVDGSTVRLAGGARLSYAPADDPEAFDRHVRLEAGRAFFEVEQMPEQFIVETPTARATVLGTSFGMDARPDETNVVLATGKVAVEGRENAGSAVVLGPGEASRVRRDAGPTDPATVDLNEALNWTGLFIFRETPIEAIAERLSTHYDVTINVAPALRGQAVTGTFEQSRPVGEVLRVLATTLDATLHSEKAAVYDLAPQGDA